MQVSLAFIGVFVQNYFHSESGDHRVAEVANGFFSKIPSLRSRSFAVKIVLWIWMFNTKL